MSAAWLDEVQWTDDGLRAITTESGVHGAAVGAPDSRTTSAQICSSTNARATSFITCSVAALSIEDSSKAPR